MSGFNLLSPLKPLLFLMETWLVDVFGTEITYTWNCSAHVSLLLILSVVKPARFGRARFVSVCDDKTLT